MFWLPSESSTTGATIPGQLQSTNPFNDKDVRRAFVRKVYTIILVQLLLTTAIMSIFVFNAEAKMFARENGGLGIALSIASIGIIFTLVCCPGTQRAFPTNFCLLFAFTVCEGFSLGLVVSHYNVETVLYAMTITCAIFLVLTAYASQTKVDFTVFGAIATIAVFALMGFGLLLVFFPNSRTGIIIYSIAGIVIFSVYIVIDTQMIMGDYGRAVQFSPEDYIAAALTIYLDIINLFLFLLQLLNQGDRE